MGAAASSLVNGPRAPHLLHLLRFGSICNSRLLGYLDHHRCVPIACPLYSPPLFSLSRPTDSRGRLLDPATFDFADKGAATEMYDIPITLVNRALYDRG